MEPPSARFIIQLFVVPGLIVLGILLPLVLLVRGCSKTPQELLDDLHSDNANVRWRAAEQLAQILPRDRLEAIPRYANNAEYALELSTYLGELLYQESNVWDSKKVLDQNSKESQERRKMILFLVGSVGNFNIPVPAPVLCEVALNTAGDSKEIHERRQLALISLANLGNNVEAYYKLPQYKQNQILVDLEKAGKERQPVPALSARKTLAFLKDSSPLEVEATLVNCVEDDDPLVREGAAYALGYWEGQSGERALVKLLRDDGHGSHLAWEKDQETDPDPLTEEELQNRYRLEIRYQALTSLARRGSPVIAEWIDDFAEMLDEERQLKNFVIVKDKKRQPDKGTASLLARNALSVLPVLHKKQPTMNLEKLAPALAKLSESSQFSLQDAAKKVQQELGFTP